jgi:hypothetical protein
VYGAWIVACTLEGDCLLANDGSVTRIGQARDALLSLDTSYGGVVVVMLCGSVVVSRLYDVDLGLIMEETLSRDGQIRDLVAVRRFPDCDDVEVLVLTHRGELIVGPCFPPGRSKLLMKDVARCCVGLSTQVSWRIETYPSVIHSNVARDGSMMCTSTMRNLSLLEMWALPMCWTAMSYG